jgi:hypothetical protein
MMVCSDLARDPSPDEGLALVQARLQKERLLPKPHIANCTADLRFWR